jgi:hypothetical protein
MTALVPVPAAATRKRLRLTIADVALVGQRPGEVGLYVEEIEPDGTARSLGQLLVPVATVPHLGVFGLLVGLKMIDALAIEGPGAPAPVHLEPRILRLLKLAGKILA